MTRKMHARDPFPPFASYIAFIGALAIVAGVIAWVTTRDSDDVSPVAAPVAAEAETPHEETVPASGDVMTTRIEIPESWRTSELVEVRNGIRQFAENLADLELVSPNAIDYVDALRTEMDTAEIILETELVRRASIYDDAEEPG